MGRWGIEAWENDAAADWYDQLFEETDLVHRIAETLILDPEEWFDEIRAAAKLVAILKPPELWPPDVYSELSILAIERLQKILEMEVYSNPAIIAEIKDDIAELANVCVSPPSYRRDDNDHEDNRAFEP